MYHSSLSSFPFVAIIGPVILLGISAILVIAFRSVTLWYWKVDRIIELLENIEHNTHKEKERSPQK